MGMMNRNRQQHAANLAFSDNMVPEKSFDSRRLLLKVPRAFISSLVFIFEGYEQLVSISTLDPQNGSVLIQTAPGNEAEVKAILNSLRSSISLDIIADFGPAIEDGSTTGEFNTGKGERKCGGDDAEA